MPREKMHVHPRSFFAYLLIQTSNPVHPATTHLLKNNLIENRVAFTFWEFIIYLRKVMGNHTYIIIFVKHFFIN